MKIKILFLITFVATAALVLMASKTSEKWPTRVIDAHVHMTYTDKIVQDTGLPGTEAEFTKQLNEVNGKGAIGHTVRYRDQTRDYKPLRILPCLGIKKDPDYARIERGLKREGYSCIKIYLGYEYQYANHENYKRVYRIAEKYDVPVVFHTGDTLEANGHIKYADPITIDEVAVEFRKVKFVLAHIGNPWIASAAEVIYKNENVYGDVAALMIGKLKELSDYDIEEYIVKPIRWTWGYVESPKKLMFGTDWPHVNIKDYVELTKRAIPEADWDRFFYQNAVDVFKLDQRLFNTEKPSEKK